MANLHIGDSVTLCDRAYFVRGISPMGVETRRVQLEDVDTGDHIEALLDEIQGSHQPRTNPPGSNE
jgi:hypothetical protein